MTKRRNSRQRKKLHLGEFQELGFQVGYQFISDLPFEAQEQLIDAFLLEAIESRGLLCGGGFVVKAGGGSPSEADRAAVVEWLKSRNELAEVAASEFVDAWYGF